MEKKPSPALLIAGAIASTAVGSLWLGERHPAVAEPPDAGDPQASGIHAFGPSSREGRSCPPVLAHTCVDAKARGQQIPACTRCPGAAR
jgi:hypothetical protein